ncbi:MAG: hypothetical protein KDD40_06915 [Bdellovibrionales bacterium]|nr:hypothetical protein [Bdellovibrionales bacterium]
MFVRLFVLSMLLSIFAWAQSEDNMPDMSQVREMVKIKWEPAGKNVKVFLVGKEALNVDYSSEMYIEAKYGLGDFKKSLTVVRNKDYFLISNPQSYKDIKLKVKWKDQEVFDYDLHLK